MGRANFCLFLRSLNVSNPQDVSESPTLANHMGVPSDVNTEAVEMRDERMKRAGEVQDQQTKKYSQASSEEADQDKFTVALVY